MLIEKKTNLYDSIVQIVNSANKNVNLYTRVGVVREVTLPTYTIEITNEYFDVNKPNESNYLYNVENVMSKQLNEGAYVWLTYISQDVPVIFASDSDDVNIIYASTLNQISGATIHLETDDGSLIEMKNKIKIENSAENLNDLLQDLITAINQITVATAVGNSSTPLNFATFQTIATKLNTLLE